MASTIISIDTSISKLATTFQTAIKATIESESAPLQKVQAQKDQISVTKGVYTDVKSNVDALQSALQALMSTQASYGMTLVPKASITSGTVGSTVLSATAADTAVAGNYDFTGYNDGITTNTGIQLAKAEVRASAASSSSTVALGISGDIWLGGTGADASLVGFASPSTSVLDASVGTVADGQRELGTGNYSVQVRDSGGVRQFRLVNSDGNSMSVRNTSGSGYTDAWQTMTDGDYDTGRGLKFILSTSGALGSTDPLAYTAKGVKVTINTTDTQRTIAAAINAALQPEGRDFKASIVANQLVLTGSQTGENHGLLIADTGNFLGLGVALQSAQNAKFQVNGMNVSRASNTNITDVIDGITLNLASDAAGKTASLAVSTTSDKATGLMNAMISKFNAAFTHLTQKLATTSKTDATTGKTTYTRGALAGDTTISSLKNDLSYRMSRVYPNTGSFTRLDQVGLSFDKDNKLTLDSTKFADAIANHPADLKALLDTGLGALNTVLSRYTGSTGILSKQLTGVDQQTAIYDKRIAKYNDTLTARKQTLYNTYLGYQTALAEYGYQAQVNDALYGTSSSTTSASG